MITEIKKPDEESISLSAELLKNGEIVAIPTETVYGLAANALDENAVKKIFEAKGRPNDNPLIVHISDFSMLDKLCEDIPELAYTLASRFWSGPLTMVLKKRKIIPEVTSGGLNTVGVRMPDNATTLSIINKAGIPLAAPSANTSGKPSPTTAMHVFEDMNGKIPLIIDDGESRLGVESTVISFEENAVRILRPGGITPEMLSQFCKVIIDESVMNEIEKNKAISSPGMKYKHYSPRAKVFLVEGNDEDFQSFVLKKSGNNACAIIKKSAVEGIKFYSYGETDFEQAHGIFGLLRQADEDGFDEIYIHAPEKSGLALAVYNRLIRAAEFDTIVL